MTLKEECKMIQQCLPESPFREQVTKLHDEMISLLQEAADDIEDLKRYGIQTAKVEGAQVNEQEIDANKRDVPYQSLIKAWLAGEVKRKPSSMRCQPKDWRLERNVRTPHCALSGTLSIFMGKIMSTKKAIELLQQAFDALEATTDSDLGCFEDEEEEAEAVPMQYAARKIMQAMEMLNT